MIEKKREKRKKLIWILPVICIIVILAIVIFIISEVTPRYETFDINISHIIFYETVPFYSIFPSNESECNTDIAIGEVTLKNSYEKSVIYNLSTYRFCVHKIVNSTFLNDMRTSQSEKSNGISTLYWRDKITKEEPEVTLTHNEPGNTMLNRYAFLIEVKPFEEKQMEIIINNDCISNYTKVDRYILTSDTSGSWGINYLSLYDFVYILPRGFGYRGENICPDNYSKYSNAVRIPIEV